MIRVITPACAASCCPLDAVSLSSLPLGPLLTEIKWIAAPRFHFGVRSGTSGDHVQGTRSSNDRLGHVITTGETPEQAMELGKQVLAQIGVEIRYER